MENDMEKEPTVSSSQLTVRIYPDQVVEARTGASTETGATPIDESRITATSCSFPPDLFFEKKQSYRLYRIEIATKKAIQIQGDSEEENARRRTKQTLTPPSLAAPRPQQ